MKEIVLCPSIKHFKISENFFSNVLTVSPDIAQTFLSGARKSIYRSW
jgi:hypothetical protein